MRIREAITDFREEVLSIIFKGYPDYKKKWDAEEINKAISSAMYNISLDYIDRQDDATEKEINLQVERLLKENEKLKETARELSFELDRVRDEK